MTTTTKTQTETSPAVAKLHIAQQALAKALAESLGNQGHRIELAIKQEKDRIHGEARLKWFDKRLARFTGKADAMWADFHTICRVALKVAKNESDCRPLDKAMAALPRRERADFIRYIAANAKVRFDAEKGRFLLLGRKAKGEWVDLHHLPPFRDFERVKKAAAARAATPKTEAEKIKALAEKMLDGKDMALGALIIQALEGKTSEQRAEDIRREMRLAIAKEREHALELAEGKKHALEKARQFEHALEKANDTIRAQADELARLHAALAATAKRPGKMPKAA